MKKRNLLILIIVSFISGILFTGVTYFVFKKSKALVLKVKYKLEQRMIANIPRAKEQLIICDFEDPADFGKLDFTNARGEIAQEHATSGKNSLKINFLPSGEASSVKIGKYFEKNKTITDWSRFEVLSFDIFNPNKNKERVLLQIKDKNGEKTKTEFFLDAQVNNHIEVDIRSLWDTLKPNHIAQFNLFLWGNGSEKVFYLDNLKLLPAAALEKRNINIASEEFLPKPGEEIYATKNYFAFNGSSWKKTDPQTSADFIETPLLLNIAFLDNKINLPFSGGVPFGRGELRSLENLELADNAGTKIPFQAKILAKWKDDSIKWVLLDLKSDVSSIEKQKFFLRYAKDFQNKAIYSGLKVTESPDSIVVNTGVIKLNLRKHNFNLFDQVWLGEELVSSRGDMVIAHNGREYHSALDKNSSLVIEEQGPLKVCLKATGWFVSERGDKFCQFITRIYVFEGESYVKVKHTFVYTGYPENKVHYLYKGKRLPANETIDEIYIKTSVKIEDDSKFTFAADDKVMQGNFQQNVELMQDKFNAFSIKKNEKAISSGNKLEGWMDVSSKNSGITLGIKNCWQQFPKELTLNKENKCIIISLWPKKAGKLDLKTTEAALGPDSVARGSAFGLAKTHDMFFYFHKGDYKESFAKEVAAGLGSDVIVTASPQWVSDTKVLGKVLPYDERLGGGEEFLSRLFDWGNRQIDKFGWYGMVDFGDTLSWYRDQETGSSNESWGWYPIGRWGWFNCETQGIHTDALIQFLRTRDYKYFKFGANLSRHIMDIDTCHYNTVANDKRLRNVIPDDYSQVGSMHRHNGNHWGDRNEETSHTNVLGLILYYYVTGDERVKDVIDEVGDFFLKERITYFRHPDVAPLRSIANVLWGEVNLYELTGDKRYKEAADKWASLLYIGQKQNGAWGEDYNPVRKRWDGQPHMAYIEQYTLPALIAYHELTGNKAIAECIIKATDFVIGNEDYGCYLDASAYAYWLTGNKKYSDNVKARLDFFIGHQRKDGDSLWDGMIYQKASYGRVLEYLYKIPFAFGVLTNERE